MQCSPESLTHPQMYSAQSLSEIIAQVWSLLAISLVWFLYLSLVSVGEEVFKSAKWPYSREARDPLTLQRVCGGSNRFDGDSERTHAI